MKNIIQIEYEKLNDFTRQQMENVYEQTQDFFREIVDKNAPLPTTCFFDLNIDENNMLDPYSSLSWNVPGVECVIFTDDIVIIRNNHFYPQNANKVEQLKIALSLAVQPVN